MVKPSSQLKNMVEGWIKITGVNFIDTADVYVGGESEVITGRLLKGKRDGVVLASKVGSPSADGNPRTSGLHKWHILKGVEESLQRLQTDCLDILYLHRPDRDTSVEETLEACDQHYSECLSWVELRPSAPLGFASGMRR